MWSPVRLSEIGFFISSRLRTDNWSFRFVFAGAVVILPFTQFLVEQHYPVFRAETIFCFVCLTAGCVAFALGTRKPLVFHAVTLCGLSVMQVPYTQSFSEVFVTIRPAYLVAASLVLFMLLARAMRSHFYVVVLIFVAVANVAGIVTYLAGPKLISVYEGRTPVGGKAVVADGEARAVIYLILDEWGIHFIQVHPMGCGLAAPEQECEIARIVRVAAKPTHTRIHCGGSLRAATPRIGRATQPHAAPEQ